MKIGLVHNHTLVNNQRVNILKTGNDITVTTENNEFVQTVKETECLDLFKTRNHFKAIVKGDSLEVVRYAPLHGHSGYSLLDGASHIHEMVEKAEHQMAITDHGNMFGALDFYKKMKKAGKQPIIGEEFYSENRHGEKLRHHLLLLAETNEGYKNLSKLSSLAYENVYYKPQLTYDWLKQYSKGIVATTGCMSGEVAQAILRDDVKEAEAVIESMVSIFGKNNYFVEIQRHGIDEESVLNSTLLTLAKKYDLKVIATVDSHYTQEEDRNVQEILMCIGTKKQMNDPDRMKFDGGGYHIHSSQEMEELYADMPEVLDNTLDLADRLNMEIELGVYHMPKFDVPAPFKNEETYFVHLCKLGFEERFKGTDKHTDKEYVERLRFEMSVINDMGFPGYFLIMWDVIRFAHSQDILVGPGRGSACGSLVAYVLRITDVDPIEYGLLFERFLNPDRKTMPDIDTDFPDDRREEVIEYTRSKYGSDAVARIVTFTRLTAKAGVRDVTRVLGYPRSLSDKVSKTIPSTPGMTFEKAFEESVEFKGLYDSDEQVKEIVDVAIKLENMPRNTGVHACGLIIAPSAATDFLPQFVQEDKDTKQMIVTTQYNKEEVEEAGLLKMDFLGLRTMGVLSHAIDMVTERRLKNGEDKMDVDGIPLRDLGVYNHISQGKTAGVFQLESPGMTSFMKQLFQDVKELPQTEDTGRELFERLVAGISLYRPGPIDEIPNYINNMLNSDDISYGIDKMEDVLKTTYGIIVYQEQCMRIVRDLAGFSRGQSDTIRKGMAKKQEDLLNEYGPYFIYGSKENNIEGCIARGIDEEQAKEIWKKMIKFSKYAFNKSHAVGYSYLSAKTGYLATYYPTEYMTATLNSFINKADKIQKYMAVSKKQNIKILPPDINRSEELFSVDGDSIRFGLKGILSVGKASGRIIEERNARGLFVDFNDFTVRMLTHSTITRTVLESLIFSGALDFFEGTRKEKLMIVDELLNYSKFVRDSNKEDYPTIFALPEFSNDSLSKVRVGTYGEMEKELKLEQERKYAGFYITEHPLDSYKETLKKSKCSEIMGIVDFVEDEMEKKNVETYEPRTRYAIAGVISNLETYYSKKTNEPIKAFDLEDSTGMVSSVAFSTVCQENKELFRNGQIVYAEGYVKADDRGIQFTINQIVDIHEIRRFGDPHCYVLTGARDTAKAREQFKEVRDFCKKLPANRKKVIEIGFIQDGKYFDMKLKVPTGMKTQLELKRIVGDTNVQVKFE